MPQLSLYIDELTMEVLRSSAAIEGVSMSRYASKLIRERADHGGWPAGYWDDVYGCLEEDLKIGNADLDASLDDSCTWFE